MSRLRRGAHARLADAADPLDEFAGALRRRYGDLARQLYDGRLDRPVPPPSLPEDFGDRVASVLTAGSRRAALNLVDVECWLTSAAADIDRIQTESDAEAGKTD